MGSRELAAAARERASKALPPTVHAGLQQIESDAVEVDLDSNGECPPHDQDHGRDDQRDNRDATPGAIGSAAVVEAPVKPRRRDIPASPEQVIEWVTANADAIREGTVTDVPRPIAVALWRNPDSRAAALWLRDKGVIL
ncbi:hypothetical protein [Gordonia sp. CPCC 206044]|uniref:hypothetical protein n=1 Tax=Gordonia sp. CPCC 206044 TaxID=3140793 RepID=UPI003AF40A12